MYSLIFLKLIEFFHYISSDFIQATINFLSYFVNH